MPDILLVPGVKKKKKDIVTDLIEFILFRKRHIISK